MRPPERVTWTAHFVDGESAWLSEDQVWVLLPRVSLDRIRASLPTEERTIGAFEPELGPRFAGLLRNEDRTVVNDAHATRTVVAERTVVDAPRARPTPASSSANQLIMAAALIIMFSAGLWAGVGYERRLQSPEVPVVAPPAAPPVTTPTAPAPIEPAPKAAKPPPAKPAPAAPPAPQAAPPAPKAPPEERGWSLVERDPAAASEVFLADMKANPASLDAVYGYGYALLKLGRRDSALQYLCRARGAGGSTAREVEALLTRNQMRCPG